MKQHDNIENTRVGDQVRAGAVIQRNSRSFSIASQLLPARVRTSVHGLYAWCRTVDDAVDEASSKEAAEQILDILDQDLDSIRQRQAVSHPASTWIAPLINAGCIEVKHAKELIAGMRMDLQAFQVENDLALNRYCYHAAGTVGLMMTRLMGVKDPVADRHAIALGVAMQLTNIARDVLEDAGRGRCYLPGISNPLTTDPNRVRAAVKLVLASAERNYRVAADGIRLLNWDYRLAIRIALALYREIGCQIQRNGYQVLHGRTVVSRPRLVWVLAATLLKSITDDLKQVSVTRTNYLLEKTMRDPKTETMSSVSQAKHVVYLGLSLTTIMATALFVMVFMNPKEASYSYLPLFYSGASMLSAVLFHRLAARCEMSQR